MIETTELFQIPGPERYLAQCDTANVTEGLAALAELIDNMDHAQVLVQHGVGLLRRQGVTWSAIAGQLGISRQAVQQRYGKPGLVRR